LPAAAACAHISEHAGDHRDGTIDWNVWLFEPAVIVPTLLVALVYAAGIGRRRTIDDPVRKWRHLAFGAGLLSLFLALESPLDTMAEHLFSMHQVQHLMLRMIAPMLIALAAPQATLISGLTAGLRRGGLAPVLSNAVLQRIFRFLVHPAVATFLFVAALYVWQVPRYHNAALLDDTIHDIMHVTMLAAGLLFWWRIFDIRPAPGGLRYGTRLMMLWIAILTQIALGAYTTLKSESLYPAYDVVGRLFDMRPLADEALGGFIIWVPSAMMCLAAAVVVIHMWGTHETRVEEKRALWSASNSDALRYPTTGAALIEQARPKNRVMALGVAAFAIMMFGMAIFAGVLNHLNSARHHAAIAHALPAPESKLR
jgi:putative membrane protein